MECTIGRQGGNEGEGAGRWGWGGVSESDTFGCCSTAEPPEATDGDIREQRRVILPEPAEGPAFIPLLIYALLFLLMTLCGSTSNPEPAVLATEEELLVL